jgi:signal peptidase I
MAEPNPASPPACDDSRPAARPAETPEATDILSENSQPSEEPRTASGEPGSNDDPHGDQHGRGGGQEMAGGRPGKPAPKGKHRSLVRELPMLIGIALVLALIIKTFLMQAFFIPSVSMENTLLIGDRVLVNKLSKKFGGEPERGQIVVFKDPGGWLDVAPVPEEGGIANGVRRVFEFFGLLPSSDQGDLIKRVIAVGGDEVRCCDERGRIVVNGKPVDEPYIFPGNPPGMASFTVKVPEDRLWVMGDHRSVSRDSSKHLADPGSGTIPVDRVVGRAFVRVWPATRMSWLPVPDSFEKAGLAAADRAAASAPLALGLVGAAPLVVLRRRRRARG